MKFNFTLLLIAILPACIQAQTTVTTNEYYRIGDTVQIQKAYPESINLNYYSLTPSWDFSALMPDGEPTIFTVQANTDTSFSDANLVEIFSDSTRIYIKEDSANSYLQGSDSVSHTTKYINGIHIDKRPFSYLNNYTDTYSVVTPTTHGAGYVTIFADSFGSMLLPSGSYSNVLDIRIEIKETDTTFNNADVAFVTTISHLWFDSMNTAPLLRIDSMAYGLPAYVFKATAQYLPNPRRPLGVNAVSNSTQKFTAAFNDNVLVVNGGFEQNKMYEMAVYNVTGQNVFASTFTASGDVMRFDMNRQLSAGMYIVRLVDMDNVSGVTVIKMVKS